MDYVYTMVFTPLTYTRLVNAPFNYFYNMDGLLPRQILVLFTIVAITLWGFVRKEVNFSFSKIKLILLLWICFVITMFTVVGRVVWAHERWMSFLDYRYTMLIIAPILLLIGYFIWENFSGNKSERSDSLIKGDLLNIRRFNSVVIAVTVSFLLCSSMITGLNYYRYHRLCGENARDGYFAFIENRTDILYTHWYWFLPAAERVPIDTGVFKWKTENIDVRGIGGVEQSRPNTSVLVNTTLEGGWEQQLRDNGYIATAYINSSVFIFSPIARQPYFLETRPVILYNHAVVPINEPIGVGSNMFEFLIREGWYGAEQWGDESFRWMTHEAYISLPLEGTRISGMEIDVHNTLDNQSLSFYISDEFIKELEIEVGRGVYRIEWDDIGLEFNASEGLTIRFVCRETFFPHQVDLNSTDTRELGIAFVSIVFN
jgi:hypothetical protein